MGIRIHTVLGWGFEKTIGLEDPRFTDEFRKMCEDEVDIIPLIRTECERILAQPKTDENWKDWHNAQFTLHSLKDTKEMCPTELICYSYFVGEYSETTPMVFIPIPYIDSWYRHDDAIDYYDNTHEDSVKLIVDEGGFPYPPFPYAGYVNRKTGKLFRGDTHRAYIELRRMVNMGDKKISKLEELLSSKGIEELATKYDIHSLDGLMYDIVPSIPSELKMFFDACKVFKDPLTMYELRPMIHKYWC